MALRNVIGGMAFTALVFLATGCSEYQKALKSTEVSEKTQLAEKLYNEGDYFRAQRLFEQVLPRYVGKPQGERFLYFYADALYKNEDYYLSGFQFDRFLKNYPQSDKAENAAFFGARSYYELSPRYSLDQADTDRALSKLQAFINSYPQSEYFSQANEMAMELTQKKERKEFEIAKQYDKLGEFNFAVLRSAIHTADNFVAENPGSIYKEEALFIKFKSSVYLAMNSFEDKKPERAEDAWKAKEELLRLFPRTRFKTQIEELMARLEENLSGLDYEQSR